MADQRTTSGQFSRLSDFSGSTGILPVKPAATQQSLLGPGLAMLLIGLWLMIIAGAVYSPLPWWLFWPLSGFGAILVTLGLGMSGSAIGDVLAARWRCRGDA